MDKRRVITLEWLEEQYACAQWVHRFKNKFGGKAYLRDVCAWLKDPETAVLASRLSALIWMCEHLMSASDYETYVDHALLILVFADVENINVKHAKVMAKALVRCVNED